MGTRVRLPGRAEPVNIPDPPWAARYPPPSSRHVYAAAHVAALPDGSIDWDATLGFREYLWAHGFAVAEAMDTAQRGMGLSWPAAQELTRRSADLAARLGTVIASGAGTDQLPPGPHPLPAIVGAYTEQLGAVQETGAQVILMASRALAASTRSARDYLDVYGHLLGQVEQPVILHWLGEDFDPALRGYWGAADFTAAADTVIELAERADGRIGGIKLSVLDASAEVALRRRLPAGVRLYTGDDFHYAELIKGNADGHSDALLGAFAAITAPAAAALHALDAGDLAGYDAAMGPTTELSRTIFEPPTPSYKAGVAFLAWLNGLQPHFAMLDGFQARRPQAHLVRVFELAAAAGALRSPGLAAERMTAYLATGGRLVTRGPAGRPPAVPQPGHGQAAGPGAERGPVRPAPDPRDRAVARPGGRGRPQPVGGHGPARGPARVQPLPGRLLHPPGRASPGQRPGGQPPGHRRGRRAGGGHPHPGPGRAAVRQPGPRPGPAHGRRCGRRPGPDRAAAGSAAGHRAHAPDVLRRPRSRIPAGRRA